MQVSVTFVLGETRTQIVGTSNQTAK